MTGRTGEKNTDWDLNPGPPAYHACTLTTELPSHTVLSQLIFHQAHDRIPRYTCNRIIKQVTLIVTKPGFHFPGLAQMHVFFSKRHMLYEGGPKIA